MVETSTDSETLGRFLYDFRRAMLRHRKSRMAFLFAIRFPDADQGDFSGESEPDKLDFQNWLDSAPPAEISGNSLYRQLQAVQANFIRLADAAVATSRNGMLRPELYAEMLRLMLRLDVLADRLASGITTAMTDLDALTGLLNRAAMERDLAQVQGAARSGGQTRPCLRRHCAPDAGRAIRRERATTRSGLSLRGGGISAAVSRYRFDPGLAGA